MTIKEIAKLANVSPTTVSQVLNRKDANISEATRRRVLEVAKKYNYRPYSRVRPKSTERSFLIGLLIPVQTHFNPNGLLDLLSRSGYSSLLRTYHNLNDFKDNLSILVNNDTDGLILVTEGLLNNDIEKIVGMLKETDLAYELIDFYTQNQEHMLVDYYDLATKMTNYLLDNQHLDIQCVCDLKKEYGQAFYSGYSDSLAVNQIAHKQSVVGIPITDINHILELYDSILVFDYEHAEEIFRHLRSAQVDIPSQISIFCVSDTHFGKNQIADISRVLIDYEQLARDKVQQLLTKVEKLSDNAEQVSKEDRVKEMNTWPISSELEIAGSTVKPWQKDQEINILTVGPINVDYYYGSREIPKVGETSIASSIHICPGGKGLNQSIAVAKLGVKSILLGALGGANDVDSLKLTRYLNDAGVDISNLAEINGERAGSAFINILEGAESSIVVYPGANKYFGKNELQENIDLFAKTKICLLQTEFNPETVLLAAKIAKQYDAITILKPCAVEELPEELYSYIDYLIPNEKEAERLLPELLDVEARADEFQKKGVGNVVITLGSKGCFYLTKEHERGYSKTLDVVSVDTTGASDAFIATIAVMLLKGKSLIEAIHYANIAAAISTRTIGVSSSFIDASGLESIVKNIPSLSIQ